MLNLFSQERKYFRFRFSRVMALVFLLTYPTQTRSGPKGCAGVVSAWMKTTDTTTLVLDPTFISSLAECINEMQEVGNKLDKLQPIIQQLPELIEKALPVAKEGGLVLLSVYVLYRSFELYNRAMNLEKDCKLYRKEFEALKDEMEPYKDFIVTHLIPGWEKGNASSLEKVTDELLQMMARQLTKMRELIQAIHTGTKNAESDIRWSIFYVFVANVVHWCSIAVGNKMMSLITFGVGVVTSLCNLASIVKHGYTLPKLDTLGKDVNAMRKEITKYRAQLDVAKMTGELYI